MQTVPHLLAYISGHGFGHVAQTAPVLNRLRQMAPDMRLTVCTSTPPAFLRSRISGDFTHIPRAADFGMTMATALDVQVAESLNAYLHFHRNWALTVADEAAFITSLAPDLVFSNVAYLPLAAARQAGIPGIAMCSLNWADIFAHYCGGGEDAGLVLAQMQSAYAAAEVFLRVTPGMPMASLPNLKEIGPIARIGTYRRDEINASLALAPDDRLVLVSMGGVAMRLPMETWPMQQGVRWLVQADWQVQRPDVSTLESLGMDFADVLTSCDALVCKPGYGSFAEAACNGVPVLYVKRNDWPEEPCLTEWLASHGRCVEVTRPELEMGRFSDTLARLWAQPIPARAMPDGIQQAADYLFRSISMASP